MSETKRTTKPVAKAAPKTSDMISVYIPMLPDDNGVGEVDQRVTVTVNGVNKIIPRGQTVKVTREEYESLYNSGRFERL